MLAGRTEGIRSEKRRGYMLLFYGHRDVRVTKPRVRGGDGAAGVREAMIEYARGEMLDLCWVACIYFSCQADPGLGQLGGAFIRRHSWQRIVLYDDLALFPLKVKS